MRFNYILLIVLTHSLIGNLYFASQSRYYTVEFDKFSTHVDYLRDSDFDIEKFEKEIPFDGRLREFLLVAADLKRENSELRSISSRNDIRALEFEKKLLESEDNANKLRLENMRTVEVLVREENIHEKTKRDLRAIEDEREKLRIRVLKCEDKYLGLVDLHADFKKMSQINKELESRISVLSSDSQDSTNLKFELVSDLTKYYSVKKTYAEQEKRLSDLKLDITVARMMGFAFGAAAVFLWILCSARIKRW